MGGGERAAVPTNLPPQYFAAEKEYRRAKSPAEKLEALETMLAVMPKHKGTDHLKAELRARMAAVSQEAEKQAGGAARLQLYTVRREGAGQAALVGLPNSGKSQLLLALTHATPKVADYPFTTQLPQPGMMSVDNALVQLVDLPPIVAGETPPWQRALLRQADLLLLLLDLSADPLTDWLTLQQELVAARITPIAPRAVTDEEAQDAEAWEAGRPKRALLVGTKLDVPGADEILDLLRLEVDGRLPLYGTSGTSGAGLEALKRAVFDALEVIRVYTKPPGLPPDTSKPFVLPRGSTIDDLATAIHHDLREKLRYATLWGVSGKFAGQRVGREHILEDQDVVELHER
jgi:hypothetical protein